MGERTDPEPDIHHDVAARLRSVAGSSAGGSPIDAARRQRFEQLATQVYEPLERYIRRRADASIVDDALSDTLVVLWRRLDDMPGGDPLPWCYGVARRCLANARRSNRRRQQLVARLAADPLPVDSKAVDSEALESGTGSDDALHAALGRLSDADRELVRLWAWERLEPREIAASLDSTPNAISIRLHRLRRRLADDLGKNQPPAGHHIGTRQDTGTNGRGEQER